MITFSVVQFTAIVLVVLFVGGGVVWKIRQERIDTLENLLKIHQQKLIRIETEYENLEAFVNHLKMIGKVKNQKQQPSSTNPQRISPK